MGEIRYFGRIGYGGGAGCATVGHAAMAVASGAADVVVAWRSRKRGSGGRPWAGPTPGHEADPAPSDAWTRPFGIIRAADYVAIMARRYLHEFGIPRTAMAEVALATRRHANRNPRAVMGDRTLTMDEYLSARWISEPLCLFDCCLETDGAVAIVVCSAERARDLAQAPVLIHAAAQGMPADQSEFYFFRQDALQGPPFAAGRALWAQSELTPADVKVAQLYDAFTPWVLQSLEGYGFCGLGEAGDFVAGGRLEVGGGGLPVNTSGGSLSEGYIHGFNLIAEGVRQIRGTSTAQVDGADVCLVTSGEGPPTSALLLRAA